MEMKSMVDHFIGDIVTSLQLAYHFVDSHSPVDCLATIENLIPSISASLWKSMSCTMLINFDEFPCLLHIQTTQIESLHTAFLWCIW
jgi:hypothetical protein